MNIEGQVNLNKKETSSPLGFNTVKINIFTVLYAHLLQAVKLLYIEEAKFHR